MEMKEVINWVGAVIVACIALSLVIVIYTLPLWWTWNYIVCNVFNVPHLTFWDTFFISLLIKMLLEPLPKYKGKE
jgi:hypothetical protein